MLVSVVVFFLCLFDEELFDRFRYNKYTFVKDEHTDRGEYKVYVAYHKNSGLPKFKHIPLKTGW